MLFLDARRIHGPIENRVEQLLTVLNYGLSAADFDRVSDKAEGNPEDNLAPNVERLGEVRRGTSTLEILLERVEPTGQPPYWRFSRTTLEAVPALYNQVRPIWIEQFIWPPLKQNQYLGVPLYQWLGITLSLIGVLLLAGLLRRGMMAALRPLVFRLTGERARDHLKELSAPLYVGALSGAVLVWVSLSDLPVLARLTLGHLALALGVIWLAWLLVKVVDIAAGLWELHLRRLNQPGRITVAQLVERLANLVILIVAALVLLSRLGVDLTTALAGLGRSTRSTTSTSRRRACSSSGRRAATTVPRSTTAVAS